jgi:hypothetical protein
MKKLFCIASVTLCFFSLFTLSASAQSFRKGSLIVSASEGSTFTKYTTDNTNGTTDVLHEGNVNGDRDPLIVEYGLSDHWGIGLNMGTDIFKVDPAKFYGFRTSNNTVKAFFSEVTVNGFYHFYVTKKLDLSAFAALGVSSVTFKGNDGDHSYKYESGGGIIRVGAEAKYYFFRRFGVIGMLSTFSSNCSTEGAKSNTVGQGYTTSIKGAALEFGLCYRILH